VTAPRLGSDSHIKQRSRILAHAPRHDEHQHSRGTFRARVMNRTCPPVEKRGHRECRVMASPMARLQQKKQAAVTTGSAVSTGGFNRSSQHRFNFFSPETVARQAPPPAFSSPAPFSVGR